MEEFTAIPGVNLGILMPAMANKFRIRYGRLYECSKEAADVLTMQTNSLVFDLVEDTYTLKIEQPAVYGQEFVDVIKSMCKWGFKIKAENLDGNVGVVSVMLEDEVWVEKHHAAMDYAASGSIVHTLTLKRGQKPYKLL